MLPQNDYRRRVFACPLQSNVWDSAYPPFLPLFDGNRKTLEPKKTRVGFPYRILQERAHLSFDFRPT